jgi:glyceraldehyde 3-phosphate dehydrogenase
LLGHQKTLDSLCIGSQNRDVQCNFEFGRSALNNIIPTATTTIDACSYIIQKMNKTNISSNSFRVPTQTVGAINVCMMVNKHCTLDNLNELFYTFENKQKYKILRNTTDACVSSDFKQDEFTTIIDHRFTNVIQNKMIKLVLWYDNEWGYASKVIDIISLYDRQGY